MLVAVGVPAQDLVAERARCTIADCTAGLARHRAALEAGADPAVVTDWIAQTQTERAAAEHQLRKATDRTGRKLGRNEIAVIDALTGLAHRHPPARRPAGEPGTALAEATVLVPEADDGDLLADQPKAHLAAREGGHIGLASRFKASNRAPHPEIEKR